MSEFMKPSNNSEQVASVWRDLSPEEVAAQSLERAKLTSENVWSQCSPYLRSVPNAEVEILGRPFAEAVDWALLAIKNQRSLKDPESYFEQWNFLPSTRVRVPIPVKSIQPSEDFL